MYQKLGLGAVTGSGFPGEVGGQLSLNALNNDFARASMAFGYGVSVTPLQLAHAYSAIAADGVLYPVNFLYDEDRKPGEQVEGQRVFAVGQAEGEQRFIKEVMGLYMIAFFAMYTMLAVAFRSYWQPFMILSTLFMAFTGVTFGLLISGNPMSLYTLYGIVALAGIAVNAAIVLISAGNMRLRAGMSVLHATIYAARRRVIPILITSLTTVAGLFSLATGLGGKSLIWGPVATAIVWGLVFSTILTLIVIPLLYRLFMVRSYLHARD